jgi:transposase
MKKISTVAVKQSKNISGQKLTIGLDLGDRSSWYCVLDEAGEVLLEQKLATTAKAMREVFSGMPRSRMALETGMHSPWVSRVLSALGHEVIVAHARNVRLIGESRKKDDRMDARTLARLARIDPKLLSPVKHRSAKAQADLTVIRARAGLVRSRTALINTARGLSKSYGERLRGCNPRNMNPEKAEQLSPELQAALEPLLAAIEALSERIHEYNQQIENIARESYPQVARLEQVKGVGTLIALTYLLTLEDPHRFRKSRDVGCYVGLQPGRRNSGKSEPQLHISKEARVMCAWTDLDNSLLDRAIEIGIVGAKAPSEPVPAALGNPLAVNDKDKNTVILYDRWWNQAWVLKNSLFVSKQPKFGG